jgi:pimeloyl-ACP methyl ester carboxylesterase
MIEAYKETCMAIINSSSKLKKCVVLATAICALLLFASLYSVNSYSKMMQHASAAVVDEQQSQEIKISAAANSSGSMATARTNIVLVHGAFADGSSWNKVIPVLEAAGHRVMAVQLPLHSLADDVATVKRAIAFMGGPTILVAHSYGGAVITNAAYNNKNVTGLVYLAAFAPDERQSLINFVDPAKAPKGLFVSDSAGFLYINQTQFPQVFAQDVNPAEASVMDAAQKPIKESIFSEKSGPPAWKQLPTWYEISENDHALPPDVERQFAKQMNATTISLPSSHASMVSHPKEVAELIMNATKGSTR